MEEFEEKEIAELYEQEKKQNSHTTSGMMTEMLKAVGTPKITFTGATIAASSTARPGTLWGASPLYSPTSSPEYALTTYFTTSTDAYDAYIPLPDAALPEEDGSLPGAGGAPIKSDWEEWHQSLTKAKMQRALEAMENSKYYREKAETPQTRIEKALRRVEGKD